MPSKSFVLNFLFLALLGLALLGLAPLAAAAGGDVRGESVKLLEAGKTIEAYDLLQQAYAAGSRDNELVFLLGQAAMLLNRPAEAAQLYEEILAREANLPRVRLELGRAYAALGENQKAKDQFRAVLAASPPPVVGENIRKYVAALESQRSWNLRVSAGYLYDSNVNAGPTASTVLMFGVPFQLAGASREQGDSGYTASFAFGHLGRLSRNVSLQSDFQYNRTGYRDLHDYNADILSFSTGPTLRQPQYVLSMPIIFEYVLIGADRYNHAVGIAPQVMVPLTQRLAVNASWTGQVKKYDVNDGMRDGIIWSASAGGRYYLWPNGYLQAAYRYMAENTEQIFLDNYANGVSLGLYAGLPAGFSLYLAPACSSTIYAEKEAAFDAPRKDSQYTVVANLSKEFAATGLSAAVGYTFTRNDSNLGMYDYTRSQVTAQLSWAY